jgi:adenylosuccinate synthase
MELLPSQIKANKPPVSEEVRLKRIEQGKRLGELRKAKCAVINAEKERVLKEKQEADAKAKEEEERIRQRRLQNIQNYWVQLSQVVSDSTVDVWRQLEQNSNIMRELLLKRTAAVADVDYQLNRNTELKRLCPVLLCEFYEKILKV